MHSATSLEFTLVVQALASSAVVLVVVVAGLLEDHRDLTLWRDVLSRIGRIARTSIYPRPSASDVPPARVA
jgi:hypothetical protein